MGAEKTKNKKLKGLSMYEVSRGASISYPTVLKWSAGGKVHHAIEKRINEFIEENGRKQKQIKEMERDYEHHAKKRFV